MEYTEEQKKFIEYNTKSSSVILSAVAGSGKTASSIERMKFLLKNNIDPQKIIFFSYTNAAVNELKERVENPDVKITTIHSFCLGFLGKVGKFRKPISFYDFIAWYKEKHKPKNTASKNDKKEFYERVYTMYEESNILDSNISAFKLQQSDGIKSRLPEYFKLYCDFLKQTRSIDFADMLIQVRNLLKENRWLRMIKNKYEYVFVDEYQDTSTIQMEIILDLNAKYYYLIGDKNQSIFSYSSANCNKVEDMLKKRRKTITMNLSTNFRSDISIIDNSNRYSDLKAIPFSHENGKVQKKIIFIDDLEKLFRSGKQVVALARTNKAVREIEYQMLLRKVPIKYGNYITKTDIKEFLKGDVSIRTQDKFDNVTPLYNYNPTELIQFIEENQDNQSFVTTIHKSKGREFDCCVVVNNFSPEIVAFNNMDKGFTPEQLKFYTFDPNDENDFEEKNVHYVAISRPKHELYFMIINV